MATRCLTKWHCSCLIILLVTPSRPGALFVFKFLMNILYFIAWHWLNTKIESQHYTSLVDIKLLLRLPNLSFSPYKAITTFKFQNTVLSFHFCRLSTWLQICSFIVRSKYLIQLLIPPKVYFILFCRLFKSFKCIHHTFCCHQIWRCHLHVKLIILCCGFLSLFCQSIFLLVLLLGQLETYNGMYGLRDSVCFGPVFSCVVVVGGPCTVLKRLHVFVSKIGHRDLKPLT